MDEPLRTVEPTLRRGGLLLRSNTRSTATRGGASGPLVATNPTAMTDPVSGRIVSQAARPRTMSNRCFVSVADVEVVENRDRYHGRVSTDNALSTAPAHNNWNSAMEMATEKEAIKVEAGRTPSSVQFPKGESQCHQQEERRGERQGVRHEPVENTGPGYFRGGVRKLSRSP